MIACVGETLEQREAGSTMDVVAAQTKAIAGTYFIAVHRASCAVSLSAVLNIYVLQFQTMAIIGSFEIVYNFICDLFLVKE